MELRATFVFDLEELSMTDRELSTAPISPERPGSSASPPLQQAASASVLQQPSPPGHGQCFISLCRLAENKTNPKVKCRLGAGIAQSIVCWAHYPV